MNRKTIRKLIRAWNEMPHDYRYQIYGIVKPRKNGEFTLNCYAVKETKRFGLKLTEVNRAWSDRPYYQCKNIWKNVWGHTMVEFDERRNRPQESYGWYDGKWGEKMEWNKDNGWFMGYIKYLNLDALAETKYKYCAFEQYRGELSLVHYCQLFARYKQVEILAKNGLSKFIEESFLYKMERNTKLSLFFRNHAKELMFNDKYTRNMVIRACHNDWSLDKAELIETARYALNRAPKGVDRVKLLDYLRKNKLRACEYYHYVDLVKRAKQNILGYGNAFPRDFRKREQYMINKIKIAQRKEDAERERNLKRIAESVNTLLEKMKNRLEWRVGEYSVIVPTTREMFDEEGDAMHNCIGTYFEECADGETMCYFIRKNGARLADVEVDPSTGNVLQCYEDYNANASDETYAFATAFSKRLVKEMKKIRKVA